MHRRVIDGRFELVERLGGGGMGLVWRAWDVALHREVALKEVRPPDPSMDEHDPAGARELRLRVLREARALARLNHPHVVTIHHIVDPGEHDYPWIVMELVTGGSLQDRLQRGPMPPAEAARLGREVLSALRAAHAVGIQHRDVKPANVLVREDGRSVLTDFGIAAVRESTSLTATGSFIGSPEYMAPERINGHEGDPASDLWSLGMMLYVAVEGRHPLRRSTTLATLAAVLNQEVPPPERAGALAPALHALLQRDPAARPDAETVDRMLAAATDPGYGPSPLPGPSGPGLSGQGVGGRGPSGPGIARQDPTGPNAGGQVPSPHGPGGHGPGGHGQPVPIGAQAAPPGPAGMAPPMAGHTMPPGYGQSAPQPPPWGKAPISQTDTVRSRRPSRSAVGAVSAAALVLAGVLVWQLVPAGTLNADDDPSATNITPAASTSPETSSESPTESPTESTDTESSAPENLLTPAGMKAMITKVKAAIGGSKVVGMTVYPTYASIEAPLENDKSLYDLYDYRDGAVTRSGEGREVDGPLADLDKYNWDALPALIKRADKDLGVPDPTTRYVIVDNDYAFASPGQVLLVYVSDDYGRGGYLVANLQGKVVKTYPDT
ncbi:serine/threonine-protein kinase [Nonomuraea sp. SYSU D8015]|uniref:serine/threonine-protein kinase n=1 Tax=Nonomuraea sp. SYSU D8015 TaxID=2593644 RepID=UPI0016609110|nr:serine/threonine-protein kinase [Nonomuraea sp. SYSU D8015]